VVEFLEVTLMFSPAWANGAAHLAFETTLTHAGGGGKQAILLEEGEVAVSEVRRGRGRGRGRKERLLPEAVLRNGSKEGRKEPHTPFPQHDKQLLPKE
jgi:hypothetical protein